MPTGFKITVTAGTCVMTFNGHQTIAGTYSSLSETLSVDQPGLAYNSNGDLGCPAAVQYTDATLTGDYTFSPTITID